MLSALFQKRRFEQAVRAYSGDLYRYLHWSCRDRSLAEDLLQETFARAWEAWEDQHDEKAVRAWLFTIARREHARVYERQRPEAQPDADPDDLESLLPHDPAGAIDMRRALEAMPPDYRDPLLLQVLGGLGCREIAQASGSTEEAVFMRLSRARKALRALLEAPPAIGTNRRSNP